MKRIRKFLRWLCEDDAGNRLLGAIVIAILSFAVGFVLISLALALAL